MRKSAAWRGSPTATTKKEFESLLKRIKLSKSKDVFYDLGCGYGRVCIWVAPKVKLAIGYENHSDRFNIARRDVEKSGYKNIIIRNRDFFFASYKKATVIYSIVDVGLHIMARINRQAKVGTRVIQYRRPNYPLKARLISGNYFLMKTPFKRVRNEDEYAKIILGRNEAKIEDLYKKSGREERNYLKKEIREAEKAWKKLFSK